MPDNGHKTPTEHQTYFDQPAVFTGGAFELSLFLNIEAIRLFIDCESLEDPGLTLP